LGKEKTLIMDDFKELPVNADRICEAISKIGYNPCSAILDIVDNSIVANANIIEIRLYIKEGTTINNRQNIDMIQVIDNGVGMNNNGIEKALQLGSDVPYLPNSLSKYGLGLKSAGFSLGGRIEVFSKQNDSYSDLKLLDRKIIKVKNKFGITNDVVPDYYYNLLNDFQSGTLITIKDITYTSRFSANKVFQDILSQAGVLYCDILKGKNIKIIARIFHTDKYDIPIVDKEIKPKDLLFWDIANETYEKETYDCKKPCKVLDESFDNPLDPQGTKIKIKATIFPQDQMKNYPYFSDEEQELIKSFEIGSKNSGFFFYRNGRLIRWGEQIKLNREFGFRAKIEFTTEHDDLFGVDVSKQQLTIPEDIEQTILVLCNIPRDQSKEVFEICSNLIEKSKRKEKEGSAFNLRNTTLEEDDEETVDIDKVEATKRKEQLEIESEQKIGADTPKYENEEEKDVFKRVRYWDTPKSMNLWESCTDRIEGTYVLINKIHPFYNHTLSKLGTGTPERQAFEAIFHALAVGQIQTIQKYQEVNYEVAKDIFNKFIRTISHQLDNWVNSNWDLFENGD